MNDRDVFHTHTVSPTLPSLSNFLIVMLIDPDDEVDRAHGFSPFCETSLLILMIIFALLLNLQVGRCAVVCAPSC